MGRLADKNILITGGNSGIGLATNIARLQEVALLEDLSRRGYGQNLPRKCPAPNVGGTRGPIIVRWPVSVRAMLIAASSTVTTELDAMLIATTVRISDIAALSAATSPNMDAISASAVSLTAIGCS